jgi:hypothetical protein
MRLQAWFAYSADRNRFPARAHRLFTTHSRCPRYLPNKCYRRAGLDISASCKRMKRGHSRCLCLQRYVIHLSQCSCVRSQHHNTLALLRACCPEHLAASAPGASSSSPGASRFIANCCTITGLSLHSLILHIYIAPFVHSY